MGYDAEKALWSDSAVWWSAERAGIGITRSSLRSQIHTHIYTYTYIYIHTYTQLNQAVDSKQAARAEKITAGCGGAGPFFFLNVITDCFNVAANGQGLRWVAADMLYGKQEGEKG